MASSGRDYQRIDALLAEALELPSGERAAFLDRACAGDEETRARIEELLQLAQGDTLEGELDALRGGSLLGDLARETVQAADAPAEDLPAGTTIGPYRLLREIGRGGMGVVFLAERTGGDFEQRVAVKVLKRSLAGDEILRRFGRERTILASLVHPNIARLYDGGTTADGRPYFTLEYVDGLPIDRYADDQRLSIEERLELFEQVVRAVAFAHQNLIVHRDIKPSNLLVDAEGTPRLLDFGIAKVLRPEPGEADETRIFERRLTPEWASPELLSGRPVTTASDVYQLGLVLYQLLTGSRAQTAPDSATPSAADWERAVCEVEPAAPSATVSRAGGEVAEARRLAPAGLARRLRGDLDNIVMKALRKDRAERYASAEQLLADIVRYRAGLPVSARKATVRYRARKFVGRNKVAVGAAALVAAALVAGVLGVLWQARVARQERDRARTEATTARQVTEFVVDLFEVADPSQSRGETVTARELLTRGGERIQTELAGEPAVRARLLTTLGSIHASLGLIGEAEHFLAQGLELRRETYGPDHLEVADSLFALGSFLQGSRAKNEAAEKMMREALEIRTGELGPRHPDVAANLAALGRAVYSQGQYQEAAELLRRALAMQRELLGETDQDVGQSLGSLAIVLHARGELEDAAATYLEALSVMERHLAENHPRYLSTLGSLATLYRARKEYDLADPLLRRVLAGQRRNFGDRHERVAVAANNLGMLLVDLGRFDEAEALCREALEIRREIHGSGAPALAGTLVNVGYVLHQKGDHTAAEALYREAVAAAGKGGNPEHPQVGVTSFWLGRLLRQVDRPTEAEPHLRTALKIYSKVYGEKDIWTLDARTALGRTLISMGRFEEAETLLLASNAAAGQNFEQARDSLAGLVALYESTGRAEEAERQRRRLAEIEQTAAG